MAENTDSSATKTPDDLAASPALSRRAARADLVRPRAARPARREKSLERRAAAPPPRAKKKAKPLRSLVIVAMVGGLIATVALPAYGAWRPAANAVTLQQVAADNAQSLVVASDATAATITRDSYSATSADEIAKKKAEEAAAARARELAEATAAAASSESNSSVSGVNLNMVAPGSGAVRWVLPLGSFTVGQRVGDRGGAHHGTDMLAPAMTPIFAAAAGTVTASAESIGGYGVAVMIDSDVNGAQVSTTYGHMTYGTRQVEAGQSVSAGQLIGFVGSTGSSTANHLHFETWINGALVDSYEWLLANAG